MSRWDSREERNKLYRKALGRWGAKNRVAKTAEECAECAAAIVRLQNAPAGHNSTDNLNSVLGELTDVMIMTEQMELVFEAMTGEMLRLRDAKLDRLEALLKECGHGEE